MFKRYSVFYLDAREKLHRLYAYNMIAYTHLCFSTGSLHCRVQWFLGHQTAPISMFLWPPASQVQMKPCTMSEVDNGITKWDFQILILVALKIWCLPTIPCWARIRPMMELLVWQQVSLHSRWWMWDFSCGDVAVLLELVDSQWILPRVAAQVSGWLYTVRLWVTVLQRIKYIDYWSQSRLSTTMLLVGLYFSACGKKISSLFLVLSTAAPAMGGIAMTFGLQKYGQSLAGMTMAQRREEIRLSVGTLNDETLYGMIRSWDWSRFHGLNDVTMILQQGGWWCVSCYCSYLKAVMLLEGVIDA